MTPICEKLLYSYKGNINSEDGLFHFFMACESPHANAVEHFLKHGVDVNQTFYLCKDCYFYRDGFVNTCTPLHVVHSNMHSPESRQLIIQMLLKYGADVHKIDVNMDTPLHFAVRGRNPDVNIINVLLKAGAARDVNVQNMDGDTPLHLAIKSLSANRLENCRLLLESGADVNIENDYGDTPLGHLCEGSYEGEDSQKCIILLLMKHVKKLQIIGFDVSDKNEELYNNRIQSLQNIQFDSERFVEAEFVNKCKSELNAMKMVRLSNRTTLLDLIFKDSHEMVLYVDNLEFRRILESENYKNKFAIYDYLLKIQFKKGLERKFLAASGKASMRFLNRIVLPNDCSEYIIQYLSNADLENISKSVGIYPK